MTKKTIGFRAEPEQINWAAVEGTVESPILIAADSFSAPTHYSEAEALSCYRQKIVDLLEKYSPLTAVGVRYPEPFGSKANDSSRRRNRIEGVILEAANSLTIRVITGALVTISKRLGSKAAKHYLDGDDLRGLDWSKFNKNLREAILTAASALE